MRAVVLPQCKSTASRCSGITHAYSYGSLQLPTDSTSVYLKRPTQEHAAIPRYSTQSCTGTQFLEDPSNRLGDLSQHHPLVTTQRILHSFKNTLESRIASQPIYLLPQRVLPPLQTGTKSLFTLENKPTRQKDHELPKRSTQLNAKTWIFYAIFDT
jgi:hypothetical protein